MRKNKGVSAIIGTIIMILITIAIATVVYLYVESLIEVQNSPPSVEVISSSFEDQNLNVVAKVRNVQDFHLVLALFAEDAKLSWHGLYNVHTDDSFTTQQITLNCSDIDKNFTGYTARVYVVPQDECACSFETVSLCMDEFEVVRW